ncbi:MurR/RpiR family transcriptional regulator [Roseovarius sp. SYSU LYC5161]|uniref:MurR/RpiR family transcriptional regulator n=1 Tax=Roseovarius halophilus (ex Wu et al. 2025) TaxID=3376060 RepID=UPI00399A234A
MQGSLEQRLAAKYESLSDKLREAGNYLIRHQLDTATRSLRSVANDSGLAPATFSRLAKALDYGSYEELRDVVRASVGQQISFADKARQLRESPDMADGLSFLNRQSEACIANIATQVNTATPGQLERTVARLADAREVFLHGELASAVIVDYFAYLAKWFNDNWTVTGHRGDSLGAVLARVTDRDVGIVISKTPYAARAQRAAALFKEKGAAVVVITDSHSCPAFPFADEGFIVPSESPQFFSSHAATLVLIESIVGMLVARAGLTAEERIRRVERENRTLESG